MYYSGLQPAHAWFKKKKIHVLCIEEVTHCPCILMCIDFSRLPGQTEPLAHLPTQPQSNDSGGQSACEWIADQPVLRFDVE